VFADQKDFNISHTIGHLIKWLSYSHRLQFPFSSIPADTSHQDDWLEAFIFLFGYYTGNVVRDIPHQAYEEVTEEMGFMRGQIAMQSYITENLAKGRHHLLTCRYEPFIYDNLYNRIVKYTAQLLLKITNETRNELLLKEITFVLDEVTDTICTTSDCDKVKLNRLYPEKEQVLQLCRWFLQMLQTDTSQSNQQNLCLLLPMEVIYEEYIAGFMVTHFGDLSPREQAQDMFLAEDGNGKAVFKMKHDILMEGKMIIDTKYKFRQSVDEKEGVSQHDMYQMVSYLYKRQEARGMLLYPEMSGERSKNDTDFKVLDKVIQIRTIDITEQNLKDFDVLQKEKIDLLLNATGLK
jgi:5-methylcytosine-specific restriction enzyme subunit McrC